MIAEQALHLAGAGAVLAARPTGVPHVYVGPLTPSGRYVPRTGRTVCRAHTRRLTVVYERRSSLDPEASRLCARCSARLTGLPSRSGERAGHPSTREEWRQAYADLDRCDVAACLEVARDADEVAAAAHLSLLLFGVAACLEPFTGRGRSWPALDDLVHAARTRVEVFDIEGEREWRADAEDRLRASNDQRAEERRQTWADREERIRRLGYVNGVRAGPR